MDAISLFRRTYFNLKYGVWTIEQILCIILVKLNFFKNHFLRKSYGYNKKFIKKWQIEKSGHFNFNGAMLPDITRNKEMTSVLKECFMDTFLISCFFNDNYDKSIVEYVDKHTREGAYGYVDNDTRFDVTIKEKDVVIDAGAWIGDFSAYAASKGAFTFAFEPSPSLLPILKETSRLNNNLITPIAKGLGDKVEERFFKDSKGSGFGNRFVDAEVSASYLLPITTIDAFVEEENLSRIDFIKADIEGAERKMLRGAKDTLLRFAPKLALCTYHYSDDPEVLAKLIKEANPKYTIIQKRHKLYACVIE